ncbi:uncharacterized protein [Sagmatias obliquidens]|uniref:uncharacterized protein isoform X2 n=1 Tax=Sagmatias obliquidens TaxID=3371155 RepID=UPI000F44488D|nr:uncharacterized protein LOC113627716 isoform X2 [Lagenorhynchus obliquidens]
MPGGASVRRRPVPRRLLSGWPPSPAAGMRPGRAGPTGFSGRGGSRAGRSRGRSSAAPVPARRAHAGVALTHRPAGPARPAAPGAPGVHASGPGTIPAPSRQGPGAPGLTAGRWGWQPSWCPGLNRKEWLTLQQDSFRNKRHPQVLQGPSGCTMGSLPSEARVPGSTGREPLGRARALADAKPRPALHSKQQDYEGWEARPVTPVSQTHPHTRAPQCAHTHTYVMALPAAGQGTGKQVGEWARPCP